MNKIVLTSLLAIISSISFTSAASFTLSKAVTPTPDGLSAKITVKATGVSLPTTLTLRVEGVGQTVSSNFSSPGVDGFYLLPFGSGETSKDFTVQLLSNRSASSNEEVKVSILDIDGLVQESPVTTNVSIKEVPPVTTTVTPPNTGTAPTGSGSLSVAIDKTITAYNEMFMVTVTGLPANYFTTGEIISLVRSSAPPRGSTACLSGNRNGSPLCQLGEEISCGPLPKYMGVNASQWNADRNGKLEFVCYLNDSSNLRGYVEVSKVSQDYTVKILAPAPIPYTPPLTNSGSPTITVKAKGIPSTVKTNYNNCSEGKGLDPYKIYAGCTDCKYLPEGFRSNFLTCQNLEEVVYKWNKHNPRSSIFDTYKQCGSARVGVCNPQVDKPCEVSDGNRSNMNADIYNCTPNGGPSFTLPVGISGLVVDINGKPVGGVKVTVPFVGFGMSWTATTSGDGKYIIDNVEPAGVSYISFKKTGYIEDSFLGRVGENETFTLRPVPTSGQLEVCRKDMMLYVPGTHKACNCPSDTTKEVIGTGFKCVTTNTPTPTSNTSPLSVDGVSAATKIFDPATKNSIMFTVANAEVNDLQACYAVTKHPTSQASVSPVGYCANGTGFVDFPGNNDWKFEGGNLVGRFSYNANTWGNGGIETVSYFRKKPTTSNPSPAYVTATIQVQAVEVPATGLIDDGEGLLGSIANIGSNITNGIVNMWTKIRSKVLE